MFISEITFLNFLLDESDDLGVCQPRVDAGGVAIAAATDTPVDHTHLHRTEKTFLDFLLENYLSQVDVICHK